MDEVGSRRARWAEDRVVGRGEVVHGLIVGGFADAVLRGLDELEAWGKADGRRLDLAQVSVETLRTRSGRISISVTADLVGGCGDPTCDDEHGGRRS